MSRLEGWTPFGAGWRDGVMAVDWCHLGAARFVEPFFYETISRAIGHPFNQAFRPRISADALAELPSGLKPSGFIFHMSRCGSTLCAQALAADPANIVLSEAAPIRGMLHAPLYGAVAPARADAWLAGIVNALGRPRFAHERRLFVKFMAADVLDIAWIARVFPDVPWLFLIRDPLEILASLDAAPGADAMPGTIPPARLGLTWEAMAGLPPPAYRCHMLAALGRAALAAARAPGDCGRVLAYADLPTALVDEIPAHFGFAPDASWRANLAATLRRDAKAPTRGFQPDGTAKRAVAAPWRALAAEIVGPVMAELAALSATGSGR